MLVAQHKRHAVWVVVGKHDAWQGERLDDMLHQGAHCQAWVAAGCDQQAGEKTSEAVIEQAREDRVLLDYHDVARAARCESQPAAFLGVARNGVDRVVELPRAVGRCERDRPSHRAAWRCNHAERLTRARLPGPFGNDCARLRDAIIHLCTERGVVGHAVYEPGRGSEAPAVAR